MDKGKYIDFNGKTPNTFYTFEYEDGEISFKKVNTPDIVAGDSDSFMLKIADVVEGMTEDEIVETADTIGEYVNKSMEDLLMYVFNTPEDRKSTINAQREVVSDVSLFLTKKRYIMRVIDKEGKRKRSIKTKGIETIKSDTSDVVKSILNGLIGMILDGDDVNKINNGITEYKIEFFDKPITEIGRPISCRGLKKYEAFYEDPYYIDDSGKRKKMTIPYQVKAAMNYNSLCSPTDKKILPGEKVLVFSIKGKMNYMAVPIDINEYPTFINDLVIDYEKMWEMAYKKIVSYLSSIEYDLKSRKENQRKSLFGF